MHGFSPQNRRHTQQLLGYKTVTWSTISCPPKYAWTPSSCQTDFLCIFLTRTLHPPGWYCPKIHSAAPHDVIFSNLSLVPFYIRTFSASLADRPSFIFQITGKIIFIIVCSSSSFPTGQIRLDPFKLSDWFSMHLSNMHTSLSRMVRP